MDKRLLQLIDKIDFQQLFKKLNYQFFTKGDYNLNIIGIRNLLYGPITDNTFNDALVLLYKVNGEWKKHIYEFSTDPGITSLSNPVNIKGCAILKPGQYINVYKLDMHKRKYKALCQRLGPVTVYRDINKDNVLDFNESKIDTGYFGINIHHAKNDDTTIYVNSWSAGCQVIRKLSDWYQFLNICEKSEQLYGNHFSYTLITTNDINILN